MDTKTTIVWMPVASLPDLNGHTAAAEFVETVPIRFAREHLLLGLESPEEKMPIAMATLDAWEQLDTLTRLLSKPLKPVLAPAEAIRVAIDEAYERKQRTAADVIEDLELGSMQDVLNEIKQMGAAEDLLDTARQAPIIKLVNLILFEAVREQASDIHFQPEETKLVVRMRIDGILRDTHELPIQAREEISSRLKIMGRMDIAEKRLAQDGRAAVQVGQRTIDLRMSSIPCSFGERIVIRILDKSAGLVQLHEMGMSSGVLATFKDLIACDHGLLLVTGPTGSGKTTTLYAALQQLDCKTNNVLTLEDPIEYQLAGISQTQVSDKKGMTFAGGLRNVLRQDPDVIMVGEIRDQETAAMAIQSALTGHLVFSSLHTNDAASAIARLLDLEIEPYLIASSLIGVLAQRLVRRRCKKCNGAGACDVCHGSGYRGRIGIFELVTVNDEIRSLIHARASAATTKEAALRAGMVALRDDGMSKVREGITSKEEVERVTMRV